MRNSYTAPILDILLAHQFSFGWVGGNSAGASHTVNFLSGDRHRSKVSFTEFSNTAEVGGISSFLRGQGYFNAEYIYQEAGKPGGALPYDWEKFQSSPSLFRLGALRLDTGETKYFGREDCPTLDDLMIRVRASSTMPGVMPFPLIDGIPYADGALGSSGGIPLEAAEADGFENFIIVSTRTRDYIKKPLAFPPLVKGLFSRYPALAETWKTRHERYNTTKERMFELEKEGRALLFFPEDKPITSGERRLAKLEESYATGARQIEKEWPQWVDFLQKGIG